MQNTFDISSAVLCYFCCLLSHMRDDFQGNDMDASRGVLSGTMDKFKMVGGIDDQLYVSMTGVCWLFFLSSLCSASYFPIF